MIKALLLILFPIPTWERIVLARTRWVSILLAHLLPVLLLAAVAEGAGLKHFGRERGQVAQVAPFPVGQVVVFETAQLILSLAIVVLMAWLIKSLGETFHGRHSFTQAFTVAAYGLSPLFLLRMLNAFPNISPWATWGVGIALTASLLYHGLPRVMLPDPPHAFGLYLMSILLVGLVTGLVCFLTTWYLEGKFTRLDDIISKIASFLHL